MEGRGFSGKGGRVCLVGGLLGRGKGGSCNAEGRGGPSRRKAGSWRSHLWGWLCRNGQEWRSDRLTLNKEVISPAGTRKFLPFLNTVAEDFVAFMHRQVRKNTRGSLTVDLYHDLFRFTLEGTARPK